MAAKTPMRVRCSGGQLHESLDVGVYDAVTDEEAIAQAKRDWQQKGGLAVDMKTMTFWVSARGPQAYSLE